MFKIVAKFWLHRFALVFVIAAVLLCGVEYFRRGAGHMVWSYALTWALLAALASASVSAYWAYQRQSKAPR